jgi:hypothetical protein
MRNLVRRRPLRAALAAVVVSCFKVHDLMKPHSSQAKTAPKSNDPRRNTQPSIQ